MSQKKKQQHYVPKGYFRLFSSDGKNIHIYNPKNKQSYLGPIKSQCAKPYFYSEETKIENAISKMETHQLATLAKIKDGMTVKNLSDEEKVNLFGFVSFQKIRTNLSKRRSVELDEFMNETMLKPLIAASPIAQAHGITEEELKGVRISDKNFFMKEIGIVLETGWLLGDLELLLLINKTINPFIFSDVPVVFYNRLFHKAVDFSLLGFQSTGLQVFCPIANNLLLLMYDGKRYKMNGVHEGVLELTSKADIERINSLQVLGGASLLYSGKRRGMDIAKKLDNNITLPNQPLIGTGQKSFVRTTEECEEHVEQFHFYEPNIRTCIDFTFQHVPETHGRVPIIRSRRMCEMHERLIKEKEYLTTQKGK